MPAMTMPFRVKEARLLDGRQRGDLVKARLGQRVALLSISFDPEYDALVVLAAHARRVGADGTTWRFATTVRTVVDPVARHFGLVVMRDDPATITHNLRTALVDRQGRLVRGYNGSDWTPVELVAEIGKLVGDSAR